MAYLRDFREYGCRNPSYHSWTEVFIACFTIKKTRPLQTAREIVKKIRGISCDKKKPSTHTPTPKKKKKGGNGLTGSWCSLVAHSQNTFTRTQTYTHPHPQNRFKKTGSWCSLVALCPQLKHIYTHT